MASSSLPSHASVIVIGGGIMGCSTLYHLEKEGIHDAILLEKYKLTSGSTWHSAAQVRALRSTHNLTELIRYSIQLYSELEKETGQHTGWIQKGSLSIATHHDRLTHIKRQQDLARSFGMIADSLSPQDIKEQWPLINNSDIIGGVFSPHDGRVSPSDLCAALTKNKKEKIFEHTNVKHILTKQGKIIGVETENHSIQCDAIALCAGLWSRNILPSLPLWPCEHFYLLTHPIEEIHNHLPTLSDHDNHLYARDESGGLLIGCFEPLGKSINPKHLSEDFAFQLLPEDWDHFEPMLKNALHRIPALETAGMKMLLNGPESFTPDGLFMLGETSHTQNLFLGCGMNSVGIASGGGAGMALAHTIAHGSFPFDLSPLDPKRFPDEFNTIDTLSERIPEILGSHYEISYPRRQHKTARHLRPHPLSSFWENDKPHFSQVYAWERPLFFGKTKEPSLTFGTPSEYEHIKKEVNAAHHDVAVFDNSPLGKIEVNGSDACAFLNRLSPHNMNKKIGQAIYTLLLNPQGTIESDLTALRIDKNHYRLFVGSSAIKRDLTWLQRHILPSENVTLRDSTHDFAILALMGPRSPELLRAIGGEKLTHIPYFQSGDVTLPSIGHVRAIRFSYVGEKGWEITCKAENAPLLYKAIRKEGATPAGLLAQTSMRIEKQFLAYGHEINTDLSPLDVGLNSTIDWQKNFIGKHALLAQRDKSSSHRIVSVILDDPHAVPIGGEPLILNNLPIGLTTSAAFGFRINAPIALALLHKGQKSDTMSKVSVQIAGKLFSGHILTSPAFDPLGTRMKN